jgi:5'-nucleotidase
MRPHILITNDDGIHAPGIKHLWKGLVSHYDISVIAPATEQSAVGLGITTRQPIRIEQHKWDDHSRVWSVTGTPADCVKLGLSSILADNPPDLIVSGMNRGSNAGGNVLYSGTVAGVIEGIMHGIPGIAFSCYDYFNPDYSEGEKHVAKIVQHVINNPLPYGTLLNVTFPENQLHPVKGFKLTRQGKELLMEDPDKRQHPAELHHYYWLGFKFHRPDEVEDSEITWLRKGFCTASPLHVHELTDHSYIKSSEHHFNGIQI